MLDQKFIRENPEKIKKAIQDKGESVDFIKFLDLDKKRRNILKELEEKRSELNRSSEELARLKKENKDISEIYGNLKIMSKEIKNNEKEYRTIHTQWENLYHSIPNFPEDDVPIGKGEDDNITSNECGNIGYTKEGYDHHKIADKLGLLDFVSASKVTASAFPLYIGQAARLELALIMYMMEFHAGRGYTEMLPPFLVNRKAMFGTGQLPKLEEDMYLIEKDDLFLNPTAEVPVTNLLANSILEEDKLPLKYTAFTTCFRREAGSYGRETKGLQRMHQFNKVELVHIEKPENGRNSLDQLLDEAEQVLKNLDLPFRTRLLCTGEMSFATAITYDLEVWTSISKKFLEVSSVSYFRDFQARRINIKYRKQGSKPVFVHTLNGSGLATPRTMIAIFENYQDSDGSIVIPDVLRKYFNGAEKIGIPEM